MKFVNNDGISWFSNTKNLELVINLDKKKPGIDNAI